MQRDGQDGQADQADATMYKVVVNHEEQYSIWPIDRENPLGWQDVGKSGSKNDCLAYIEEVWTDMRPLSLRKQMEETAQRPPQSPLPASQGDETSLAKGSKDDLVTRLAKGDHPIEASLRPERTAKVLQECIDRGYVHITFTSTTGKTELGLRLDRSASDLSQADFERPTGTVHLVGGLVLNYVKVSCIADLDLTTLGRVIS